MGSQTTSRFLFLLVCFYLVSIQNVEGKKKIWLIPAPADIIHCDSYPSVGVFFSIDAYHDIKSGTSPLYPDCKGAYTLIKEYNHIGYTKIFRIRLFYSQVQSMLVIALMGTWTTSMADWANDIIMHLVPCTSSFDAKGNTVASGGLYEGLESGCGTGKLHEGFLREWAFSKKPVLGDIEAALKKYKIQQVLITGHSKGAALTYLAAADIKARLANWGVSPKLTVMNYGSPRPGDSHFSDYYLSLSIPTSRYAINGDPVPTIPPTEWGYQHVGGQSSGISRECLLANRLEYFCHEGYQAVIDLVGGDSQKPLIPAVVKGKKKRSLRRNK